MKLPIELSIIRQEIICSDYKAGLSVRQISAKHRMAMSSVYEVLYKYGLRKVGLHSTPERRTETVLVDMNIDYTKKKKLRNELIYRLRTDDLRPIKEIAKIFNIHYSVVTRVVQKHNKTGGFTNAKDN